MAPPPSAAAAPPSALPPAAAAAAACRARSSSIDTRSAKAYIIKTEHVKLKCTSSIYYLRHERMYA